MTEVAQWLPNGIVFLPGITFEQWEAEWLKIDSVDKAIQWVTGDALRYAEANFGEAWTQVVDAQYAEKHRAKLWLARAIPPEQRREGFSYSFHRELGKLDRAERDRWFDRALAEGWNTVERLREERGKRPGSNGGPPIEPPLPVSEDDYGTESVPQLTTPAGEQDDSRFYYVPPSGNRTEMLRALIRDVREFGDGWKRDPAKAEELYKRMDEVLGKNVASPLEEIACALALKPAGWRVTILEKDDGFWEVRLRADGQKQAIAMSAYLENALTECCLAAEIGNG